MPIYSSKDVHTMCLINKALQNIYLHVQWRCTFHPAHFRAVFAGGLSRCSCLVLADSAAAFLRTRMA